jgi:hypothetical protein
MRRPRFYPMYRTRVEDGDEEHIWVGGDVGVEISDRNPFAVPQCNGNHVKLAVWQEIRARYNCRKTVRRWVRDLEDFFGGSNASNFESSPRRMATQLSFWISELGANRCGLEVETATAVEWKTRYFISTTAKVLPRLGEVASRHGGWLRLGR